MKKIILSLFVGMLLPDAPVSQAAYVPHPVIVSASRSGASANPLTAPVADAAIRFGASTPILKGKKVSFFAKIKKSLRAFGGEKSQLIALLLAVFLGAFGIHRFYLGYIWEGIAQVLLCFGGIVLFIVGIALFVVAGSAGAVVWPMLAFIGLLPSLAGSIWVLVDLIRIAVGSLQPKGGTYDSTL